jgi:hypothetical protein
MSGSGIGNLTRRYASSPLRLLHSASSRLFVHPFCTGTLAYPKGTERGMMKAKSVRMYEGTGCTNWNAAFGIRNAKWSRDRRVLNTPRRATCAEPPNACKSGQACALSLTWRGAPRRKGYRNFSCRQCPRPYLLPTGPRPTGESCKITDNSARQYDVRAKRSLERGIKVRIFRIRRF